MLKHLMSRFSHTLYVQIWPDNIQLLDLTSGNSVSDEPVLIVEQSNGKPLVTFGQAARLRAKPNSQIHSPFTHPRTLLADFAAAEKLLQLLVKRVSGNAWFTPPPFVIIHPMAKTEGGLTMIEARAFRELALGAGAHDTLLYQGPALSAENFDLQALKQANPDWRKV